MSAKRHERAICVVDADASVREALARLLSAGGLRVRTFASVEEVVAGMEPIAARCVLMDSSLLGNCKAQGDLMRNRCLDRPMIVLCAGADESARREARARGACFLLSKPVDAQALFDAIAWVTEAER